MEKGRHKLLRKMDFPLWAALVFVVALLAAVIYVAVQWIRSNYDAIFGDRPEVPDTVPTNSEVMEHEMARTLKAEAKKAIDSGKYVSGLTVMVTTSPVPSNPSTQMIGHVIDSVIANHGMPEKLIIAMDGLAEGVTNKDYDLYERKLVSEFLYAEVVRRPVRGYLTGNIDHALQFVKTKFLLIVQHDFLHVQRVDLTPLMGILDDPSNPVQYIRFNKRNNWQREKWDYHPTIPMNEIHLNGGKTTLTSTPAWSDNDHLVLTSYYRNIVIPLSKEAHQRFPEDALNPINRNDPKRLGTYIYGSKTLPATIKHLDGKIFQAQDQME